MRCRVPLFVNSLLGIHMRPAMRWVRIANEHSSSIEVEYFGARADGKSMMELVMLAVRPLSVVHVSVDGDDGPELLSHLSDAADEGFGDYGEPVLDVYETWGHWEQGARFEYIETLARFSAAGQLSYDRLVLGVLPEGFGTDGKRPEVVAVIDGTFVLDGLYVRHHKLGEAECSRLASGARYVIHYQPTPAEEFCACVHLSSVDEVPAAGAALYRLANLDSGKGWVCAIGYELLSRRGPVAAAEAIPISARDGDPIAVGALMRQVVRSPEVREFMLRRIPRCDDVQAAAFARSAWVVAGDPELLGRIERRIYGDWDRFLIHCLADAVVWMFDTYPEAATRIAGRLAEDKAEDVRWRVANAARKAAARGGSRAALDVLERLAGDASGLVRYEASRFHLERTHG